MLYPRESETREVRDLCGIWNFRADPDGLGRRQSWFAAPLADTILMPVPSSYNDITQDARLRDHIGDAWYDRTFYVPAPWQGRRIMLRVDSATHHAEMWVNGESVATHKGGYLPFEADVGDKLRYGSENRVTLVVSNVLDGTTLPPGRVETVKHPWGTVTTQCQSHDFFNYAGLHRPVRLYTTPTIHIDDVTVETTLEGRDGFVAYSVRVSARPAAVQARLLDAAGGAVAAAVGRQGRMRVRRASFWAPGSPYLYLLEVSLLQRDGTVADVYRLPVGIRTVAVRGRQFLLNGEPFYFKGCCKHEDADLRGKGFDAVTTVKDFNLLAWMGANSTRTSHYPYAEEFLDLADRLGIAVIDESPAVGLTRWGQGPFFRGGAEGEALLAHHRQVMRELVARDKNHPCVVMWSVANEPASSEPASRSYFRKVVAETRGCDSTRPVTMVTCTALEDEQTGGFLDVICLNRYTAWYTNCGRMEIIEPQMVHELRQWFRRFRKPMLLSEYGADTIPGFHSDPPVMFSEEFQQEFLDCYHRALDRCDFIIGEHVWNLADFATQQEVRRVGGNRKGVCTRQRQPKMAAHRLRERWTQGPR